MKRVVLALAILLVVPAWAQARVHTVAPPGNSSVGQYLETVPTAGGGQPTNTVHPHTGGAVSGRSGGGGPTGGNTGAGASVTVPPSTRRALAAQGPTGAAAAALAQATAPAQSAPHASHGDQTSPPPSATSSRDGLSPAVSVFKAFTGSTSKGGLGPLLPIVLIGSVLAGAVLALVRRRRIG
jgi:hypothetical protein